MVRFFHTHRQEITNTAAFITKVFFSLAAFVTTGLTTGLMLAGA